MYCVYEDEACELMLSAEGVFTNPDEETDVDGDEGDAIVKKRYCAVAQTKLASGMDDSTENMTLVAAVFRWADTRVIKVDDELLYIKTGYNPASVNLTVQRGWNNTTPAVHSSGAAVRLAYDGKNISITCRDNEQVITGDESDWIDFCLDSGGDPDGDYSLPLALGDIDYDEVLPFHRRLTVPAETPAQSKQDLIYDVGVKLVPLDS